MFDVFWFGIAVTAVSAGLWFLSKTFQTPKKPFKNHRLNYQRLRRKIKLNRRRAFKQEQIRAMQNLVKQIDEIPLPNIPNKYVITNKDDCPICFGNIELEIVPCGHGICKACFAGYNNVCCLCQELVATIVEYKQ